MSKNSKPTDSYLREDQGVESLISPKNLALRWSCSYSTAQRIAERAGISKVYLGEGKNGLVRYPLCEIVAYESARTESCC